MNTAISKLFILRRLLARVVKTVPEETLTQGVVKDMEEFLDKYGTQIYNMFVTLAENGETMCSTAFVNTVLKIDEMFRRFLESKYPDLDITAESGGLGSEDLWLAVYDVSGIMLELGVAGGNRVCDTPISELLEDGMTLYVLIDNQIDEEEEIVSRDY